MAAFTAEFRRAVFDRHVGTLVTGSDRWLGELVPLTVETRPSGRFVIGPNSRVNAPTMNDAPTSFALEDLRSEGNGIVATDARLATIHA